MWVDSVSVKIIPFESSEVRINEVIVPPEGAILTVGLEFTIGGTKLMLANPDGSVTVKSPNSTFAPSLRSGTLPAQTFPFAFRKAAGQSSSSLSSSTSAFSASALSSSSPSKSKSSNMCLVNDEATQFASFEIIGNNSRSNFPNNDIDITDAQNTNPLSSPDRSNSQTKTSRLDFTNTDFKRATAATAAEEEEKDRQKDEDGTGLDPPPQKKEKKPPSPPPPLPRSSSSNEPENEKRASESSKKKLTEKGCVKEKEEEEEDKIAIYLFGVWALKAVKLSRKYAKVYERHFYQSRYGMSISTIECKVKDFVYKTRSEVCNDFVKIASDSIVVNIGDKALCSLAVKFYTDVSRLFNTKGVDFAHINFDELLSTDDSSFVTLDDFGSSRSNSENEGNDYDDDDDNDINMDSIIPSDSISIASDVSSFSKDPIADNILKSISHEEPKHPSEKIVWGQPSTVPEAPVRAEASDVVMAGTESLVPKKAAEERAPKKRAKTSKKGRKQKVVAPPPPPPKPVVYESAPMHRSESYEYKIIGVDFMKKKKHSKSKRKSGPPDLPSELRNQVPTESQTSGDDAGNKSDTLVKPQQEVQHSQLKDEMQPLQVKDEFQKESDSSQNKEGSEETEEKVVDPPLSSSPLPPPSEEIVNESVKSVAPVKPPGKKRGRKKKCPEGIKVNDTVTSNSLSEATNSNLDKNIEAHSPKKVDPINAGVVQDHKDKGEQEQENKDNVEQVNKEDEAVQTIDSMEVIPDDEADGKGVDQKTEEAQDKERDVPMEPDDVDMEEQHDEKEKGEESNSQQENIAATIQESVVVVMTENLEAEKEHEEEKAKEEKECENAETASNDPVAQSQSSTDTSSQDVVFNPTDAEPPQTAESNTKPNDEQEVVVKNEEVEEANDNGYGDLDDIMIPASFLESPQSDKSMSLSFDRSTSLILDLNDPDKEGSNSPSVDDVIAQINSVPPSEDKKPETQKDPKAQCNITALAVGKQEPSNDVSIPACSTIVQENKPPASQADTQGDVTMNEPAAEKNGAVDTLPKADSTPKELQEDTHKSVDQPKNEPQKGASPVSDSVANTEAQIKPAQSNLASNVNANPVISEQSQSQEFDIRSPETPPDISTTTEPRTENKPEKQSNPDPQEDVEMSEPSNEKSVDSNKPPVNEKSHSASDANGKAASPKETESKPHEAPEKPSTSSSQGKVASGNSKTNNSEGHPDAAASKIKPQNASHKGSDPAQNGVRPNSQPNAPTRSNTNPIVNSNPPKAAEKSVSVPNTSNSAARADPHAKSDATRQGYKLPLSIQPSATPLIPTPGLNLARNSTEQKASGGQPQTIINNRGTSLLGVTLSTNSGSTYIVNNRGSTPNFVQSSSIVQNAMGSVLQSGIPTYESMDSDQSCDITMDQGSVFSSDEAFVGTDINVFASGVNADLTYYTGTQVQGNGYQGQVYTDPSTFAYTNTYGTDGSGSQAMNYVQQSNGYVETGGSNGNNSGNGGVNGCAVSQGDVFQGNYDYMGMQAQNVVGGNGGNGGGQSSLVQMDGLNSKVVPQYGNFGMYVNNAQNGLTDCYGNYTGTQAQGGAYDNGVMCPNNMASDPMIQQQQQQQQYMNNQGNNQRIEPQNNNHFFPIAPTRK